MRHQYEEHNVTRKMTLRCYQRSKFLCHKMEEINSTADGVTNGHEARIAFDTVDLFKFNMFARRDHVKLRNFVSASTSIARLDVLAVMSSNASARVSFCIRDKLEGINVNVFAIPMNQAGFRTTLIDDGAKIPKRPHPTFKIDCSHQHKVVNWHQPLVPLRRTTYGNAGILGMIQFNFTKSGLRFVLPPVVADDVNAFSRHVYRDTALGTSSSTSVSSVSHLQELEKGANGTVDDEKLFHLISKRHHEIRPSSKWGTISAITEDRGNW
ncbi:uncharacterized protein BT62DRAFT_1003091 [Guyanagaster necrorhizus]|uniref:Uncharacterized protein n=1 Tax=Guyanagaster necrorhizus TaxID=856835 RepID=A0A9P7VYX4_9AGAR|nr:uncharacterized protein BT62DRAFT_1003091 [Guyanagaster necrorhizus MCA 3950]KAG7448376.1 hypothetical protein BT62DRAFT_1003091 [Guyanagaster necrorhizus MCA 3950]